MFVNVSSIYLSVISLLFSSVDTIIEQGINKKAYPSAVLLVAKGNEVLYQKAYGRLTYDSLSSSTTINTIYDIASLTKPLMTLLCAIKLYEENKLSLKDPVTNFIPEFATHNKEQVLIENLLLHNSGLIPYRDYRKTSTSYKDIIQNICRDSLTYALGTKTIYSDLNFVILAEIISCITSGRSYNETGIKFFFKHHFILPLKLNHTYINPPIHTHHHIAPTEKDTAWLPSLFLRPLVHDPTSAVAGGTAGNSGVFSSARDVFTLASITINKGKAKGIRFFEPRTVKMFTKKMTDRTLGWDMKTSEESMSGKYFSYETFGHLGFTGTSIWIDPTRDLTVIFLTNRVFPTSLNKKITKLRPLIHNAIILALEPQSTMPEL